MGHEGYRHCLREVNSRGSSQALKKHGLCGKTAKRTVQSFVSPKGVGKKKKGRIF
jgi:hypothetical protein